MKNIAKVALLMGSVVLSGAVLADGKSLYETRCASCHGVDAKTPIMETYPKLAGQNAAYLEEALKAYKAGKRTNQQGMIMTGMASALSDGEIKQISEYLSNL